MSASGSERLGPDAHTGDPDPRTMSSGELADVLGAALRHAGCPPDAFEWRALGALAQRASDCEGTAWLDTFLRGQDAYVAPAAALHREPTEHVHTFAERRLELDALAVTQGLDAVFTHTPLALSNLHMKDHPPASPYRCHYCGDAFDVAPWFIYDSRDKRTGAWRVRGNFCSAGCMMRAVSECDIPGMRDTWAMNCAVVAHQRLRLPVSRRVPVAPDRRTREDFGGVLSIAEWRRIAGYGMKAPVHDTLVHYATGPFVFGRAEAVKEETRGGSAVADCNNLLQWMASTTRVREVDPTPSIHRRSTRAVPPEQQAPEMSLPRKPLQQEVDSAQGALRALHFPPGDVEKIPVATQCALITHLSDEQHGSRGADFPALTGRFDTAFPELPRLVRARAHQILRGVSTTPAPTAAGDGAHRITEFPSHRVAECVLDDVAHTDGKLIREAAAAVAAARRAESSAPPPTKPAPPPTKAAVLPPSRARAKRSRPRSTLESFFT